MDRGNNDSMSMLPWSTWKKWWPPVKVQFKSQKFMLGSTWGFRFHLDLGTTIVQVDHGYNDVSKTNNKLKNGKMI